MGKAPLGFPFPRLWVRCKLRIGTREILPVSDSRTVQPQGPLFRMALASGLTRNEVITPEVMVGGGSDLIGQEGPSL